MSVVIHIWKGAMPKMAVFNAIYHRNVGHASISIPIVNNKNEKDYVYISHRPRERSINMTKKDDSKKYVIKGYVPKASPISFRKDCENRGRKPDIEIRMSSLYLNRCRMLSYYEKYLHNQLPKTESFYHIGKNNCCSVVVNFIRQGLNCQKLEKKCYKCEKMKYQKGLRESQFTLGLILVSGYIMNLYSSYIPIFVSSIIYFCLAALNLFWLFIWFSNLERSVMGIWGMMWNFWSPLTLEVFANEINKQIKLNRDFSCPRKEGLGFINSIDWDLFKFIFRR